jgi:hypothetical protein
MIGEVLIDRMKELGWYGIWGNMIKKMKDGRTAEQGDDEWKKDRKILVDKYGYLYSEV